MSRLIYLLIALILALVGQRWLSGGGITRDSAIVFLIAGVIFALASRRPSPWPDIPLRRKWQYRGIALAAIALVLTAIASTSFWSGVYGGWAFWLWLVAIVLFVISLWLDLPSPDPKAEEQASRAWLDIVLDRRVAALLLLVIILLAAAVRFYALDVYPNGCQSDECNNGLDALKWLSGNYPYIPYAETNEGQATLFTYLIAGSISLFGQTVTSMRMVSALVGTLTVVAVYFLAREVYGQRLALITAALVAADRWHITFSRIVYELIMMPLVLSLQMLFMIKALKSGRRRWWGLSGLMLALGMNTYTAYRIVPAFVGVFFLYWLIAHRHRIRRDLEGMVVFAAGAVVGVAPLGVYIIRNWNVFISRINHISVFRDVEAAGSYAPLWSNLRKTLLMFNVQGDAAALNNLPGAPLLQFVIAATLVLGIIWAIRWVWREMPFLYLVWFVGVTSLAVLSVAHEAPTARRPIGLVPVIYLLVAAVFQQFWWAWTDAWGQKRWRPLAIGLGAVAVLVMLSNINTYFRVQAVDPSVWAAYSPNESAVGEYLADVPPESRIFMAPQLTHHSAVHYIGGEHDITPLNLGRHVPLREDPGADVIFVLEPVDERLVPLLQQLYPDGVYQIHRDRFDRPLYLTFSVPRFAFDAARGLQVSYSGGDRAVPPMSGGQASTIDVDFSIAPPMAPPFLAQYEGALLVPQFGEYTLELLSEGGQATLYLDDIEVLTAQDGSEQIQKTLPGGFHGLRVSYEADVNPGRLRLRWATPQNSEMSLVDASALYTLPGASNGLVGYYYATPDWSGTPSLIQRDLFILPNPALREPFSIRWVGKVAAPTSGRYVFGTRSDDGSLVYVDGQLVVDNSGSHGSEYREGVIELTEGFHDIEVLYNELGGSREMQLWWQPPTGGKSIIPGAYLYPVEENLPEGLVLPPPPEFLPPAVESEPQVEDLLQPESDEAPLPPAVIVDEVGEFPAAEPAVLWTYGVCGEGAEQLLNPAGVAIDGDGYIYVTDSVGQRVVRISPDGDYIGSWGEAGEGEGQFTEPFDITVTPNGEIAVLDAVNQVISLWTPEGDFIRQFGAELTTYRPRGFTVTADGQYFIADTGGVRVLQTDANGQRLNQFGGPEEELGPGQPTDAAVSTAGILYVAEPTSAALWRVDLASGQMRRYPSPEANTVASPHLAVSANGRVFLTDPEGGRVLVLNNDLSPLAQFGGRGTGSGQFGHPVGIAVGEDGTVAVADFDLCRVTAFSGLP
ncbi:MAG: glycosyltransferase family 39 protein [Caldilineales bacterium]|nr:glycosyltransferase family 39 protein [Caldilineales bacterium]